MSTEDDGLQLISRYLDGDLSPEELAQLEERILSDNAFADECARMCLSHRQAREVFAEHKLHEILESVNPGKPSFPAEMSGRGEGQRLAERRGRFALGDLFMGAPGWMQPAVLTAAVILLVTAGTLIWRNQDPISIASVSPEQQTCAATITRLEDCLWSRGTQEFGLGQQIFDCTTLALDQGTMKLNFESGAEVFLEGPCELHVQDSMLAYLRSGSITANVPRRAFKFAIRSPGIDFVDLGTSFGVSVDESGQSELHVFEGEVIYRQDLEGKRSRDVVHVLGNDAVEFVTPTDEPRHIVADKESFAAHFKLQAEGNGGPGLPVKEDLALWLGADRGLQEDGQGRVLSWHDRMCGDNKIAEDAIQHIEASRPKLVADSINGLPALRFDGRDDYMLTTPIETTDNQTVFIVCQYSEGAFDGERLYGGQIINYDGPPTRELSGTLAPGVLQIGEPIEQDLFKPSLVSAQVFAGFVGNTTVNAGLVTGNELGANLPAVLCYRYNFDARTASLWINGKLNSEALAFAPAGLTSRKIIGRHAWMELFFCGDLGEMVIYNSALTDDDIDQVGSHLAKKYVIREYTNITQ